MGKAEHATRAALIGRGRRRRAAVGRGGGGRGEVLTQPPLDVHAKVVADDVVHEDQETARAIDQSIEADYESNL